MYRLSPDCVRFTVAVANLVPHRPAPNSIGLTCHKCADKVAMTPNGPWFRPIHGTYVADYSCPSCSAVTKIAFFTGDNDEGWRPDTNGSLELYQWPPPKDRKEPNPYFLDERYVPKRIGKAYAEAVRVMAVSHTGSAVHSRRTLEGIAKHFVADATNGAPLAKLLKRLPEAHDIGAPILRIANALRDGGNLAAHFDSDEDVSRETSEAMLELLEDLIEFLFVLPHKIEQLQERFPSGS